MVLPVWILYEKGPYRPPQPKPSERLAYLAPYAVLLLVVMGVSSAIYHDGHVPVPATVQEITPMLTVGNFVPVKDTVVRGGGYIFVNTETGEVRP